MAIVNCSDQVSTVCTTKLPAV